MIKTLIRYTATALTCVILAVSIPFTSYADTTNEYQQQMEERKSLPIQSNEIANWPEGPAIGAESAILMEMNTHTILYAKNIHEEMYPASTTKIMTCLLSAQNCNLDEKVTFSHNAVYGVPSDGSNMGIDEGEVITMEQACITSGITFGGSGFLGALTSSFTALSSWREAVAVDKGNQNQNKDDDSCNSQNAQEDFFDINKYYFGSGICVCVHCSVCCILIRVCSKMKGFLLFFGKVYITASYRNVRIGVCNCCNQIRGFIGVRIFQSRYRILERSGIRKNDISIRLHVHKWGGITE